MPDNVGADYLLQLTAEKLTQKRNQRGAVELVWMQVRNDNHWGDCEVMQLVAGFLSQGVHPAMARQHTPDIPKPPPVA